MPNKIILKKKISDFNKKILIPGDKSISIRWVLISSIADGVSKAKNLLMSEDVLAAINAVRKLGVRVVINNNICKIHGVGIKGLKYKLLAKNKPRTKIPKDFFTDTNLILFFCDVY